jgi:hypothetical protein
MFGQNVFHYRGPRRTALSPKSRVQAHGGRHQPRADVLRFWRRVGSLGSGAHGLQGQRHSSGREGAGPLPVAREPAWTGPPGGTCVGGAELERCPELCPRLHRTLWSHPTCKELLGREPCPWTLSGRSHNPSVGGSNPPRPMSSQSAGNHRLKQGGDQASWMMRRITPREVSRCIEHRNQLVLT